MKRAYLFSLIPFLLSGCIYAQITSSGLRPFITPGSFKYKDIVQVFDTVFFEDFTDGSVPQGWIVHDNTGNDFNWICTDQPPGGDYSGSVGPIASGSGGFFMQLRADYFNSPLPSTPIEMDSYFQFGPLDCSANNTVSIKFEHYYRWCCQPNEPFQVLVSNDNTNWASYSATVTSMASSSDNPTVTILNISQVAANQPQVYIRFHMINASHYFWMVDDILLFESPDHDVAMNNVVCDYYSKGYGFYSQIPLRQTDDWSFNFYFTNNGEFVENPVTLESSIEYNGQHLHDTSALFYQDLYPGISDTTFLNDNFSVQCVGNYSLLFSASVPNDQVLENNYYTLDFSISDTIFAHDHGNQTGSIGPMSYVGSADGDIIGNVYYFKNADTIRSISVFIDSNTTPGVTIRPEIYLSDTVQNILLAAGNDYVVLPADCGAWVTMPVYAIVDAGSWCIAAMVCQWGANTLLFGDDMSFPETHSFESEVAIRLAGNWYYSNVLPMIRLNTSLPFEGEIALSGFIGSAEDATCPQANDGSATIMACNGFFPYSFLWSNGGTEQTIQNLGTGWYTVTITDNVGNLFVDSVYINEQQFSNPISGAVSVIEYDQYEYTVELSEGSTYDWSVTGGVIVSGQYTESVIVEWGASGSGLLSVVESTSAGCISEPDSLVVEIGFTGLSQVISSKLIMTPNPFSDFCSIRLPEFENEFTVRIFDIGGRMVRVEHVGRSSGYKLGRKELVSGVYFVEISGINHYHGKLIVAD